MRARYTGWVALALCLLALLLLLLARSARSATISAYPAQCAGLPESGRNQAAPTADSGSGSRIWWSTL
jgi:hypothetical protein